MAETGRRDLRRRLEQLGHNPRCAANTRAALGDVPMLSVARSLGLDAHEGQSPFAITRGLAFERALFADDAARLRQCLLDARVLPPGADGFVDLRPRANGGPRVDLDDSRAAFLALLQRLADTPADARSTLPTLVAGPALRLCAEGLPEGRLALDVVTVHPTPDAVVLRVGEVKVYPDRGGYTDPAELASARAQAGLYLYALRREIADAGLSHTLRAADDGFLVLTRPSFNLPSVRAGEDLRYQHDRAAALLAQAASLAQTLPARPDDDASALRWVAEAPRAYSASCMAFCPLAPHCHRTALRAQQPEALGEDMARHLGDLPLHRAAALLRGEAPETPAERAFATRLP